jgi:hypothetical protein
MTLRQSLQVLLSGNKMNTVVPSKKGKTLHWIEDNLEEYLMKTTFSRKR